MAETSHDSNQQMRGTIQPTPGTTPNSGDSIVALPQLSKQEGPISLTLTIDKSVGKVAAWVVGLVMFMAALVGAGIVMSVWMIFEWRAAQMEARIKTQEVIYLQAAVIAHGIPLPHPPGNDHAEKLKE